MIKKIVNFFIDIYQKILSPDHGIIFIGRNKHTCRFIPTCSQYTKEAINKYGTIKGLYMGTKRLIRCGPWTKGSVDYP